MTEEEAKSECCWCDLVCVFVLVADMQHKVMIMPQVVSSSILNPSFPVQDMAMLALSGSVHPVIHSERTTFTVWGRVPIH